MRLQNYGDVAQLARALDWQSRGRGFESHLLHFENQALVSNSRCFFIDFHCCLNNVYVLTNYMKANGVQMSYALLTRCKTSLLVSISLVEAFPYLK